MEVNAIMKNKFFKKLSLCLTGLMFSALILTCTSQINTISLTNVGINKAIFVLLTEEPPSH